MNFLPADTVMPPSSPKTGDSPILALIIVFLFVLPGLVPLIILLVKKCRGKNRPPMNTAQPPYGAYRPGQPYQPYQAPGQQYQPQAQQYQPQAQPYQPYQNDAGDPDRPSTDR